MELSRPQEECGVFGIYNHSEASNLTYLGLYALQHRGQESCGIVSSDGASLYAHKRMGLVADVFSNPEVFKKLPGKSAIGHVRYSTAWAKTTGSTVASKRCPWVSRPEFRPKMLSGTTSLPCKATRPWAGRTKLTLLQPGCSQFSCNW